MIHFDFTQCELEEVSSFRSNTAHVEPIETFIIYRLIIVNSKSDGKPLNVIDSYFNESVSALLQLVSSRKAMLFFVKGIK